MRVGEFRKRIQLQQRAATQDGYGQQQPNWVTLLETWAQIEPISGAQLDRARSIYNQTSHRVTVRWRPRLEDIKQVGSYRVLFAGRIFDVGASMNLNERNTVVVLLCSEGTNEGG